MKSFTFLHRLTAVLFMAMLTLCVSAQMPVENHNLDLGTHGIGEIVTIPQFDGLLFHNDGYAVAPESGTNEVIEVRTIGRGWLFGQYENYWQYEVTEIWCRGNGTDPLHLTRYEFDENNNPVKQINYTITLTVQYGMVEVGTYDRLCDNEEPDPTVLKDTTIHYGDGYYDYDRSQWVNYTIDNYVGFRYASVCYEDLDGNFKRGWNCVNVNAIQVTSSDPSVVEVTDLGEYWPHELKGLKRGTATITVTLPENSEYGVGYRSKTVQYNVTVTGDDADEVQFWLPGDPYRQIDELVIHRYSDGASDYNPLWPVELQVSDGIGTQPLTGDFTLTSSDESVATIEPSVSNEVNFTFQGYGTTTITVNVPGDDYINDRTASFTLTFVDPNAVDMYFIDDNGNRITHLDVTMDASGNPVMPFEPRFRIEQNGADVITPNPGLDLNLTFTAEDPSIITDAGIFDSERYLYMNFGSTGVTDLVADFAGFGYDAEHNYVPRLSPGTARLTVSYKQGVDIRIVDYEYNEWTVSDMTDNDCGRYEGPECILPRFYVQMSDHSLPITIASSDESVVTVTYDELYHEILYEVHGYGSSVISVTFEGSETVNPASASFVFNRNKNTSPMAVLVVKDADGNTLSEDNGVVMTEGQIIRSPYLAADGYRCCYNQQAGVATANCVWKRNPETGSWDYLYALKAGVDTITFTYFRHSEWDDWGQYGDEPFLPYWDMREEIRIPIVIMPLVTPVETDEETTVNLNPANANISFSGTEDDVYNAAENQLEIKSVVTEENLSQALNSMAAGSAEWNSLLPGSVTFNINPGKGKIKIQCATVNGYVLKVLIRDHGTVTINQPVMDIAEVNYDVEEVTTVLIYLARDTNAPAPQHRSLQDDAPNAIIKSILISPDDTPTTGIDNSHAPNADDEKRIENGQLVIIKNGVRYNAQGQMMK